MRADDTKAAPSLADEFAMLEFGTRERDSASLHWCINNAKHILAALRAVEAVRAFPLLPKPCPDPDHHPAWCPYCNAYEEGVEAVQAVLKGER